MKRTLRALVGIAVIAVAVAMAGAASGKLYVSTASQNATRDAGAVRPASEGVQVHGHWAIDVVNPDGAVASHTEFDNAFTGQQVIGQVLTGQVVPSVWEVYLVGTICTDANGLITAGCAIFDEHWAGIGSPSVFRTLTATAANTSPYAVALQGTAVAAHDGSIDQVMSVLATCAGTVAPFSGCALWAPNAFTGTHLAVPVSVLAGQQVLVKVTITFS